MMPRILSVDATEMKENNDVVAPAFPKQRSDSALPNLTELHTLNVLHILVVTYTDSVLPVFKYFLNESALPKKVADTTEI
jgi:hypothetical protein